MRPLELGPCRARALNGVVYSPPVPFVPPLALKGSDGALAVLIKVNPLLYSEWEAIAANGARIPVAAMAPPLRVLALVGGPGPEWVLLHDVFPYAMGAPTHFDRTEEAAAMDPKEWLGAAGTHPDAELRAPHSARLYSGGKPLSVFANLPKVRAILLKNVEAIRFANVASVAASVAEGEALAPKTAKTYTRADVEITKGDITEWRVRAADLIARWKGGPGPTTASLSRGKLTSRTMRMLLYIAPRLDDLEQVWLPKLFAVTRVENDYETGTTVVQVEVENVRGGSSSVWVRASALSTMYRRLTERYQTQIDIRDPQEVMRRAEHYHAVIKAMTTNSEREDE